MTFHSELLQGNPEYRILPMEKMKAALRQAGFGVEIEIERMPVADEDRTRRGLLWVRKPA